MHGRRFYLIPANIVMYDVWQLYFSPILYSESYISMTLSINKYNQVLNCPRLNYLFLVLFQLSSDVFEYDNMPYYENIFAMTPRVRILSH